MTDEDQSNGKYIYAFKSTVYVVLIVCIMVVAIILAGLFTGVDGEIHESISNTLKVVATILSAVLGTKGAGGDNE